MTLFAADLAPQYLSNIARKPGGDRLAVAMPAGKAQDFEDH
jgi:hypothetical protein